MDIYTCNYREHYDDCDSNSKQCFISLREIRQKALSIYSFNTDTYFHIPFTIISDSEKLFSKEHVEFSMNIIEEFQKQNEFTVEILSRIKEIFENCDSIIINSFFPSILNILNECVETMKEIDYIDIDDIIVKTGHIMWYYIINKRKE